MDPGLGMHGVKAGFNVKDLLDLNVDNVSKVVDNSHPGTTDPGMTRADLTSASGLPADLTDLSQAAAMTTYYDQDNPYSRWLQTHDNIYPGKSST